MRYNIKNNLNWWKFIKLISNKYLFYILLISSLSCANKTTVDIPESPTAQKKGIVQSISFDSDKWHSLKYSSIPANTVTFSSDNISIIVNRSASPLIYPMTENPIFITEISIKGEVNQLVDIKPPEQQGEKNLDDFNLRLGLVLLGDERLNRFQKLFAPEWVKKMFELAPKDQGIDHIHFLNAVLSPALLNKNRTHPLSEYIKEHYVWLMNTTGTFSYSHTFQKPKHIGALWIAVDGDDSQSEFILKIQEISIKH